MNLLISEIEVTIVPPPRRESYSLLLDSTLPSINNYSYTGLWNWNIDVSSVFQCDYLNDLNVCNKFFYLNVNFIEILRKKY